jgi:molybdenum cofactor biosynthesis enzyme MoaA
LNTNGQGYLINKAHDVIKELEDAGLSSISISLNSTSKEEYNRLHRPKNQEAFNYVLEFIKKCLSSSIETQISFIEFKNLDKAKALDFSKALGLKESQVRFRSYIE